MKVTDHIKNAKGKTLFSFELIPPQKGRSIQELYNNIDPLMDFKPPFIDVTTSREEFIYIDREGLLDKKLTRMRPGTVGICASITHKYNVDAIPHVLCGGFTKEETEYLLVDCHYLGIDNVMALRGDAMKEEKYFTPAKGGHAYANELVKQIVNMNKGQFLHEVIETGNKSDFCVGVAAYPEKHMEAPSMDSDIRRLKDKVDAGADYVVTQMFFDNKRYFDFVERAKKAGVNVPIIPGIKPVAVKKHLQLLPQVFKLDMPDELVRAVEKCSSNKEVREVGIEFAIQQSKELMEYGVPVLHYYSMGKSDNIKKIAEAIF
ncbi:methylenetetrahydrofolate reductase [NAD(P)H] [Aquimarina muelleri]|uniref:Methylenetetrahydrofolate reductase n=1 Tax=Aquimarina muelleri TaxID=279356 RepID=A0A918N2X0_9FLAO|nr:methylenetetrahydrofolate reductase [NAD(P)H] [Aquimarina muelleri]MCX2763167.1 methylenetetrahydrofolate reductase [NAD(P)H] [Aquimarina muelleri]GGX06125.1 methylenetetrahydrofolate reductase [Aquimarina muelleri]